MTRHRSTCVLVSLLFVGVAACGDDGGSSTPIDAANVDSPTAAQTCANYCSTITTNCSGALTQYSTASDCMNTCMHFPAGTASDQAGNTLGCRIYHAGVAANAPDVHCRHAGPGGDGACGANCEGFCTLVMAACAGQATPPYASMSACMTACGGFATSPPYDATQTGGNSFACRLYHATAASTTPNPHCGHVGMTSPTCQ